MSLIAKQGGAFKLATDFKPMGDQPAAIEKLVAGIRQGRDHQTLLGVTGSGKTFTVANVIAQLNKPALILAPNKTLAAQLYSEFKQFFPENAVEYFVSYYDYYQPEAYIPSTDTFIEKDSAINEEIDKMRHSATRSLLDRSDVLIVSSVSCIYGLGSPEAYEGMLLYIEEGREFKRQDMLKKLVEIQYTRSDVDFHRGTFRVRGDIIDVFPAYEEDRAVRIELFGDTVDAIFEIDPLRGVKSRKLSRITIYPGSHYVTTKESRKTAIESIRVELRERLQEWGAAGKVMEAKRLESRTMFDLEMMEELGYCQGVENYSRHLTGRPPGAAPPTLLEYFPKDFLLFIDESHVTVPQIGGMYRGDRARKMNLVEHGFRLPSALDNRPMNFQEFEACKGQRVYVSATPGPYELKESGGEIIEQIIRPTGLIDPVIEVRPARSQVDDLLTEIKKIVEGGNRVLVTTLTKKLSEDLTNFYANNGVKVKYLHSDIETLERIEILRELREGVFDVLVGINLLREGLDLPEVSLVAILDADKEGFLRSERSLIQTIGRAARNVEGRVILYADSQTESMRRAMGETERRRKIQAAYNSKHGITPTSIKKAIHARMVETEEDKAKRPLADMASGMDDYLDDELKAFSQLHDAGVADLPRDLNSLSKMVASLEKEMKDAAKNLEFERAAGLRDRIRKLRLAEMALR
ncbi:MAG: excinuclease ABC subunit UvrB [Deltaproteobacteria bacterium]|nr:excinuclease ABC subunit UvrB [Deltaproteobacteria bacterium]